MLAASFIRKYALTSYTFEGDKEDYFVARLIHRYMRGRRVLDLGCGPVVKILSIFYPDAREVVGVDRLQENLDFVKNNTHDLDAIMKRANAYQHHYLSKKKPNDPLKITLVKGDVRKKLPLGKFDSVMNMGCFGALDTPEDFYQAVKNAYGYLKKGGTLLMVNWIGDVKRPYRFNGKIYEPAVYRPALEKAGFIIKELHFTAAAISPETRRMGYRGIIWAVAKK